MGRMERVHVSRAAIVIAACAIAFVFFGRTRRVAATDGWLPISPADLALKDNPAQPGADAMILYREDVLSAKDLVQHGDSDSEYIRIKIFTQAGVKYGNVEIPYVKYEGREWIPPEMARNDMQILDVHARTIRPDGSITNFSGKVLEKVMVSANGYKLLAATFTLPDVQPGCIIEYRYTKAGQPRWIHNEEWDVSGDMYTREAHFTFIPYQGYSGYVPYYRLYGMPAAVVPKCDVGVDKACVMEVHDIPAVVEEPLMPPAGAVEARVEWYYQDRGQPFNEAPEHFWNRQAKKWSSELDHFAGKKDALQQEVNGIVSPNDSPETKLRKIYARVQQIRNLSDEDKTDQERKTEGLKENGNAEDVLSRGYGTGKDMNFLFAGLARAAGFEADEVYVGTRDDMFFNPAMEDADELDGDVVWVHAGSQDYYLDPAARTYPFGILPWEESGAAGVRASKDRGEVISVPGGEPADAVIRREGDLKIESDGNISGTLEITFAGQEGALRRRQQQKADETGRKKALEDEIQGWLPAGSKFEVTKISNWADASQPLAVEGTLKLASFASAAARRILLPQELFQSTEAGNSQPENRSNAIYFHYPFERVDDVKFHLPAGYKVESVPKAQDTDLKAVSYQVSCATEGDTVEVKRTLTVGGILFPKENYPTLRAFFGVVKETDGSDVVLQNAQTAQVN